MKINPIATNYKKFSDINPGVVFQMDGDATYLKIEEIIATDFGIINAICLEDGTSGYFVSTDLVVPFMNASVNLRG